MQHRMVATCIASMPMIRRSGTDRQNSSKAGLPRLSAGLFSVASKPAHISVPFDIPDVARRIAGPEGSRRYILGHHGAGADHAAIADRHARQDRYPRGDPDMIADDDLLR